MDDIDQLIAELHASGGVQTGGSAVGDTTRLERWLRVLADVTCDVTGPTNMLPVNTEITTWEEPVRRLDDGHPDRGSGPLDVIAIEGLSVDCVVGVSALSGIGASDYSGRSKPLAS